MYSPIFPTVDVTAVGGAALVDNASDNKELAPVAEAFIFWADWAAIICWIHCCWAGLNSGASLDDDATEGGVMVSDDDIALAEEVMLNYNNSKDVLYVSV